MMVEDDVEGEDDILTVGDRLRSAREAAGLSVEDVATSTRIPTRHLESLEASDFARLPAPTYTVGFAKNYAGAVGLDRDEIGDLIRAELGSTRPPTAAPDLFEPADPARAMPRWLIFAAIGALVLVVLLATLLNRRSIEAPDEVALENLAGPVEEPPAAAPPAQGQGPVVITATEQVWLSIKDGTTTLREGIFEAGESFELPATATAPVLTTGKPEALRISVGTTVAPPVGPAATTVSNVSLLPADLLRTAAPAPVAATPAPPAAEPRPAPPRPATRTRTRAATTPAAEPAPAPANTPANSAQPAPTPEQ